MAELCRRLAGLPLAIELAAAQVRGLPPEQLLERLDQRLRRLVSPTRGAPPRHQTLQATIDWSYGLLSNTDRILFDRLGVFSGGWTVDAAEAVVSGQQLAEEDVLPALLRLVDKSLVVAEPGARDGVRYRLLEPVRQDAWSDLLRAAMASLHASATPLISSILRSTWSQRLQGQTKMPRLAVSNASMTTCAGRWHG